MKFLKLPGKENTSDIMTKAVEAETLNRHMSSLGMDFKEGRHIETPDYDGHEDGVGSKTSMELEEVVDVDREPKLSQHHHPRRTSA